MTTEIRKAALDAILERINLEGYQNYDGFAKEAAVWFEEREENRISEEAFVSDFRTGTDFHRYNEISDREALLKTIYADAIAAIDIVPSRAPTRLFVDDIDSFSRVTEVDSEDVNVDDLQDISEAAIKTHLREIIGEPFEQGDWGGELNDLFTNQVEVNGERVYAAFMLKGPSVPGEMQMGDAGARGDQVQRLFESGADLFIVQYNGKMEDRFVKHVQQQAEVTGADMFCIMDGTDTARVLEAYGKI